MVGLDGRIAWASTYFCDLVGVEHDKIAGMSCFDFVFPEDMEAAKARFEENRRPNAAPFRFRLRRVDGIEVWVDTGKSDAPGRRRNLRDFSHGYCERNSERTEGHEFGTAQRQTVAGN
jgi:PAS domain S-box-containing protein